MSQLGMRNDAHFEVGADPKGPVVFAAVAPVVYACSKCGGPATRSSSGVVHRPCGHDTSAITASLTATATGEGGM